MSRKIKVDGVPLFEVAVFLDSDSAITDYLSVAVEDGDIALVVAALGHIAKARGITNIANQAGISRTLLCAALTTTADLQSDVIARACAALGVRLLARTRDPD